MTQTKLKAQAINLQAWQSVTYLNSWVDFGASFNSAQYMKDSMGFVHLRGLVKSGTVNTVVFNLPAGYRPTLNLIFPSVSNDLFGEVRVGPTGDVSQAAGSNTWLSLEGITFLAEQ